MSPPVIKLVEIHVGLAGRIEIRERIRRPHLGENRIVQGEAIFVDVRLLSKPRRIADDIGAVKEPPARDGRVAVIDVRPFGCRVL